MIKIKDDNGEYIWWIANHIHQAKDGIELRKSNLKKRKNNDNMSELIGHRAIASLIRKHLKKPQIVAFCKQSFF